MSTTYTTIDSPLGELLLACDDAGALMRLHMQDGRGGRLAAAGWRADPVPFEDVVTQLHEYFAGTRRAFEVPLAPSGGPFELRVWEALRQIPYGETASYGEIARQVCGPAAARAVGRANARNPVAVIVPCHRVIGADGSLTGFGGGLPNKRRLLDLEAGRLALV
jgi:methylated-DNA-[protein]-cysteine S-methyltransferase